MDTSVIELTQQNATDITNHPASGILPLGPGIPVAFNLSPELYGGQTEAGVWLFITIIFFSLYSNQRILIQLCNDAVYTADFVYPALGL